MDQSSGPSYSEDLWDGFYTITAFYSKQKEWMKGIYNTWKAEGEQIHKLGKYYKSSYKEKKGGSDVYTSLLSTMEDELRDYHSFLSERLTTLGSIVEKDLYTELHDIKMQVSDIIKYNTTQEKKLEKDLKQAQSQAAAAQRSDASQCQTLLKLAEARKALDLSTAVPKRVDKMNKQLIAAKENASRARSDYEKKVEILSRSHKIHEEEMKTMLDSMQKFDENRLKKTKDIVLKYTSKQVELARAMLEHAEKLHQNIEQLDAEGALHSFINQNKAKTSRPAPDTFQPYFPDSNKIDEIVDQAITVNNTFSTSTTLASSSQEQVKAIYDYSPETDEEIEIKCDDILDVIEKREDGWWNGKNTRTGAVGLFPANYVEEYIETVTPASPNPQVDTSGKMIAVALYDYETTDPGEVEFVEGDQLTIHEAFDDGWCFAENNRTNMKGLAPLNYLQM